MNFLVRKDKIMDKKYKRFVRMYENYITEIEMYKEMIRELKKSLDKTREGNYRVADLRIEEVGGKDKLTIYLSHESIITLIQEYKENIDAIENKLEEFYLNSFTKNEDEISYDELKDSLKNFDLLNLD